MQKSFLQLNNCNLYFEVSGTGPAIIFAHGLGGNYKSWYQQIPYFSKKFTCITFSHRGFSPSSGIPDLSLFADDLSALIRHLKLTNVHLVGQSMGGWTCFLYALKHQNTVQSLTLSGSIGAIKHSDVDRIIELQHIIQTDTLRNAGINPAAGKRMMEESPGLYKQYNEIGSQTKNVDKDKIRKELFSKRFVDESQYFKLTIPVLCICGDEDGIVPPEAVKKVAELLPNAKFTLISKTGHSTYFERPETFNAIVDKFIGGLVT